MANNYDDLLRQAGQLVFFGFDGYEMNEHAYRAIRDYHIGNVILFTRNYRDPEQFYELIRSLQREAIKANGAPMLVAIDHEGGSVFRLVRDVTWLPGPLATRVAGDPELARRLGRAAGEEMAAFGLNLNLAPVMNVATNPNSPHAGARCWGADPTRTPPYGAAYIQGVQEKVYATAKHFPSIGNSSVDLHTALGRNTHTREELESCEMLPIKKCVEAGVRVVMSSHEIYPAIDDEPGTLSRKIITGYLKEKYGFKGAVISDCMEMKALANYVPTPEACVRAIQAGVDMLLICHTEKTQIASVEALAQAIGSNEISEQRIEDALSAIASLKQGLRFPEKCPDPAGDDAFKARRELVESVCDSAITESGDPAVFTTAEEERFLVIAPPPVALTLVDEKLGVASFTSAVKESFPHAKCIEYPIPLKEEALSAIREEISKEEYSKVIIGTYNAHDDPGQRELLNIAYDCGKTVGAVALRTPCDARWYRRADASLLIFEYTPPMVAAAMRRMRGEIKCTGHLPADVQSIIERETV